MVKKDIENNEEIEEITDEQTDTIEPELEDIEEANGDKLQQLRAKLKQAEADKRDALEELATAKADFLNARRRLEEDKQRGIERQKIKDVEALLPLCDSFHLAMADQKAWQAADDRWRKGVEGIYGQLQQTLVGYNVTTVDPTGDAFDPNLHEAMGTIDSDQDTDTIVQTLQLGYTMGDTIIRHAKVILSN